MIPMGTGIGAISNPVGGWTEYQLKKAGHEAGAIGLEEEPEPYGDSDLTTDIVEGGILDILTYPIGKRVKEALKDIPWKGDKKDALVYSVKKTFRYGFKELFERIRYIGMYSSYGSYIEHPIDDEPWN